MLLAALMLEKSLFQDCKTDLEMIQVKVILKKKKEKLYTKLLFIDILNLAKGGNHFSY